MQKIKKCWKRCLILYAMILCLFSSTVTAAPSVDELTDQKQEVDIEVDDLQKELTELLNRIGEMEEKLIYTGEKITQTESDLAEAEDKQEEQYEAMKVRIKYMYENGESDVWAMLLTAENFSDFLNKAEYVSNVHSYDRNKLEELIETEQEIETLKDTLETEQQSLEDQQKTYIEEQERVNEELEEKRAESENYDELIQAAAEAAALEAEERETSVQTTEKERVDDSSTDQGSIENDFADNQADTDTDSSVSDNSSVSSSSGNTSAAQAIVDAAYSQLGVPYVYGGTTPGVGLDCSGLVQYCHAAAGISLPRTSQAQGGCGVAVSDPQPGDIVCYSGHVGIYIGNGQMIHAPQTGDVVKIADVYGSPWYRRCW